MRVEVLSVGDEVVSGQIVDSNAAWLSQRLAELGLAVARHVAVRDDEAGIRQAIAEAAERSDLVFVTGGLGPTHDDLTREAAAEAAGAGLVLHPPALEHVRSIFAARGIEMPRSNEGQATVPRGADVLLNELGTAAGFRVRVGGAAVFVLPGVPGEMKAMFGRAVVPLLPKADGAMAVRMLRCFGLPESIIAETLGALLDLHGNPKVAFLPSQGVVTVKFTACADRRERALDLIERPLAQAREALGRAVFGEDDDTLEAVVAGLLVSQGRTIALAESCTGGLVAGRLTHVPGVSQVFLEGLVTYGDAAKTRLLGVPEELLRTVGAVSEEVARQMAENVRERSGADLGVGITGIAGPTGGSPEKPVGTVHVAVATAARTTHTRLSLRGGREQIRGRAAQHALNLVRLDLLRGA